MVIKKLQDATKDIAAYREEIINRMLKYSATDMLLFWGSDKGLMVKQEKEWTPLLEWARKEFDGKFVKTNGLDVPEEDKRSGYRLKSFMENLSDKELAAFYLAALNMRSVLLASALVKGRINAEQAYKAAYLEELYQAQHWGVDEDAESRRNERRQELSDIEKFLKS